MFGKEETHAQYTRAPLAKLADMPEVEGAPSGKLIKVLTIFFLPRIPENTLYSSNCFLWCHVLSGDQSAWLLLPECRVTVQIFGQKASAA
jgi:hypothetical protein